MVSELIMKEKLGLYQLTGKDPGEIIVPFNMMKLTNYGHKMLCQGAYSNLVGWVLTTNIPKTRKFNL